MCDIMTFVRKKQVYLESMEEDELKGNVNKKKRKEKIVNPFTTGKFPPKCCTLELLFSSWLGSQDVILATRTWAHDVIRCYSVSVKFSS